MDGRTNGRTVLTMTIPSRPKYELCSDRQGFVEKLFNWYTDNWIYTGYV